MACGCLSICLSVYYLITALLLNRLAWKLTENFLAHVVNTVYFRFDNPHTFMMAAIIVTSLHVSLHRFLSSSIDFLVPKFPFTPLARGKCFFKRFTNVKNYLFWTKNFMVFQWQQIFQAIICQIALITTLGG